MRADEADATKELFDKANSEFVDILTKNVPTFDRKNIMSVPTQDPIRGPAQA